MPSTNQRLLALLLVLLAVALVLGVRALTLSDDESALAATQAVESRVHDARVGAHRVGKDGDALTLGAYSAPKGREMVFEASLDTQVNMRSELLESEIAMNVIVNGELRVLVADRRADEILAYVVMDQATFVVASSVNEDQDTAAQERALSQQLKKPCSMILRSDGEVLGYALAAGVDENSAKLLRALVEALQFVIPAGEDAEWTTTENRLGHDLEVQYRWTADRDAAGRRYIARNGKRSGEGVGAKASGQKIEDSGVHDAVVGWIRKVEYEASQEESDAAVGTEAKVAMSGRITLKSVRDRKLGKLPMSWEATAAQFDKSPKEAEGSVDADLANVKFDDLMREIRTMLAVKEVDPLDRDALHQKLADYLAAFPEALDQLRAAALVADATAKEISFLFSAAARSGTPEAALCLSGIASETSVGVPIRQTAAVGLANFVRPDQTARTTLKELATSEGAPASLQSTGYLMLGIVGDRLVGAEEQEVIGTILSLEDQAQRQGMTSSWLESLGNTGSEEILNTVEDYLESPDVKVRSAAVNALRRLENSRVGQLLQSKALNEPNKRVRSEAVQLLAQRNDAESLAAVGHVLSADNNRSVRLAAIAGLKRQIKAPGARRLLADAARRNTDAQVRLAAARSLGE